MKRGRENKVLSAAKDGFLPKIAIGIPERNQGGFPSDLKHDQDDLYDELWRACAGPSVYVPRAGEKVFYFPQGHLEQVAAFADQREGLMEMPVYDLPSKILCRVMTVQLKAEVYTDEVFAQITLLPLPEQGELRSEDKDTCRLPCRAAYCSFSKTLTPSDTSTHGGFSIPKRHADECFPLLDMSQEPPSQELIAKDLHGFKWHFRHIFRGHPKRHLLTSGWSTFVNSKGLVAGDACIFLSGENGELCIGIRRAATKHHKSAPISACVISGHSMQLGILASASHAVATGSMFTVYYHPWTNPSEFIIPLDQYMKSSAVNYYSVGTRVQIHRGAEEFCKRRYAGTIVGIGDIDSTRWPDSQWRCLKVQWDGILDTYVHPERVCPWSIESLGSTRKKHIPILPLPKSVLHPSLPGCVFDKEDIVQNSVKHAAQIFERDLQGQDYNEEGSSQHAHPPRLSTNVLLPSNVTPSDSQLGMGSQMQFVTQNPSHQSLGSSISLPDDNISTSSLPSCPPIFPTYVTCNNVSVKRDISISNVNSSDSESQGRRASEPRDENEVHFGHPHGNNKYKLFGFSLIDNNPELPSPQVAAFSKISSPPSVVAPMSQSSVSATIPPSEPSKSISGVTSEKENKKWCSVNSRSCTKVLKHGTALGRSIDLTSFPGYDELISELDRIFGFRGSLINGNSGWQVTYTDDDGDMMLLGDYPWQDFQFMVQKMIICRKEDMGKMNASSTH